MKVLIAMLQRISLAIDFAHWSAKEIPADIALKESDFLLKDRAVHSLLLHSFYHLWAYAFDLQFPFFIHHAS